ncbi:MAG TPA: nodulation protein NfeD [Caldilineaceae bacterium]|nr:nodulation protein NfeD [Caldilineaceae bacterium]
MKQLRASHLYLRLFLLVLHLTFFLLGLLGLFFTGPTASYARDTLPAQATGDTQLVYLLTFEGAVTPVLDQYIEENIAAAQEAGARLIILQLDTPGGSVDITQGITQRMLSSPVPIAVYVAPAAARAGSAGTFITLAGHVAAMAPGSSIGAASPVGAAGEDVGETMEAKIKNILSADIENLAARRGEDAVKWAIAAVQEATAATADQALELGVIDFIATDPNDLLTQMDGFVVTVRGEEETLHTDRAVILEQPLSGLQEFLNFIANPTIASLLLTLGTTGLLIELWNPGTWIPGVAGAVCLLLGLYALGQLDANFAGLALMAVAVGLFIAEAFTPTFGALTTAGVVAFVLGGVLLFDRPGINTPWFTIIGTALFLAAFTFFAGVKGLAAQRAPAITGSEGLIGQRARVKESFATGETGSVFVAGEWWNAELVTSEEAAVAAVSIGEEVKITGRRGYTLLVEQIK